MARILLVDDNADILKTYGDVLRRAGHEVVTAANGNEALRLAEQSAFDLVITDLVMPDKEGIETIMALRNRTPTLKIIAMSGGGLGNAKDYLPIARYCGAAQTLAKPVSASELRTAVTTVLGLKSEG